MPRYCHTHRLGYEQHLNSALQGHLLLQQDMLLTSKCLHPIAAAAAATIANSRAALETLLYTFPNRLYTRFSFAHLYKLRHRSLIAWKMLPPPSASSRWTGSTPATLRLFVSGLGIAL